MRAALHFNTKDHQSLYGQAMKVGLERHGIEVIRAEYNQPIPCDFAVMWGWKQEAVIAAAPHVLVMERGHLPDRMAYASIGWNGLAGRGTYAYDDDGGRRWYLLFSQLLRPWRETPGHYALVIGQVPGDAALGNLDHRVWSQRATDQLLARGHAVVYRPHPEVVKAGGCFVPKGAVRSFHEALADDLAGATFVVTFNSTAAVESVLFGVPTIATDQGSMAWPVTSHAIYEPIRRPERVEWAKRLSWCQWSLAEIQTGYAWERLRPLIG